MVEENIAQNLQFHAKEDSLMDSEVIKDDILMDLDDVERLTLTSGLNPILKTAINRIAQTFQLRVAYMLSPIRPGRDKPLREECLQSEDLEDINPADLDNLEEISGIGHLIRARAEIRSMIVAVLENPRYIRAVKSYRRQATSAQDREHLYHFLSHYGFQEHDHLKKNQLLYHGISLGEFGDEMFDNEDHSATHLLSPETYAKKIQVISREGLKAAPAPENLPLLESIFCVSDIRHAYGVAAVTFPKPQEEKLWGRSGAAAQEGMQLVKPRQTGTFKLVLRSPAFYDALDGIPTKDIFGKLTRTEYRQFLDQLKPQLTAANLPFQMINPDGTTAQAEQTVSGKF